MKKLRIDWTLAAIAALAVGFTLFAPLIPNWLKYTAEISIAGAMAAVGVMFLLRAGLLSLGQGLFFFVGAYAAALLPRYAGINDIILLVLAGGLAASVVAALLGFFIARYRSIFFAMLTLAVAMVVYGIAVKVRLFGGSDGLNITQLTLFGSRLRGAELQTTAFILCLWTGAISATVIHLLLKSRFGKLVDAIEDNEVRVEYLGRSVRSTLHLVYIAAGTLAGIGGALAGIAARHVDPNFSYWTTSGEFVFITLLSGQASVLGPFAGAIFLELLRTFSAAMFPDEWQLIQGGVMLIVILFLPNGLAQLASVAINAVSRLARHAGSRNDFAGEQVKP